MAQLRVQHQEELSRVQTETNLAHGSLHSKLQQAEQQNQWLTERLEFQQRELAEQQSRFNEMRSKITLQNQLAMLQYKL